jgi:hypothetical protein
MAESNMDLKERYKKETGEYYRSNYSQGDYGIHTDDYVEWVENKLKSCEGNKLNSKPANCAIFDVSGSLLPLDVHKKARELSAGEFIDWWFAQKQ